MILKYYFNYYRKFLSNLNKTINKHKNFSLKKKTKQYPPHHSTKQLNPPILHNKNLLNNYSKFTKFNLFTHIFKKYNQQFKIYIYINFILSFYHHQILKKNTLLYKIKYKLIITKSNQINQYNKHLLIHIT